MKSSISFIHCADITSTPFSAMGRKISQRAAWIENFRENMDMTIEHDVDFLIISDLYEHEYVKNVSDGLSSTNAWVKSLYISAGKS